MIPTKRGVSYSNIDKEVKKAFAQVNKNKKRLIAEILNKLNLTTLSDVKYRKIVFSYESLFKLILFMKLKGIKYQTNLVKYLKTHKLEQKKLKLKRIPDQTTISYFLYNTLNDESKKIIEYITDKIQENAEKSKIILDIESIKPDRARKKTAKRNLYIRKKNKKIEVCRFIRKAVFPFIDVKQRQDNAKYRKNDFLNILIKLGLDRKYAEGVTNTLREKGKIIPQGDTLLYHLKKPEIEEIKKIFLIVYEIIWIQAKRANMFKKPVDVAIDMTDIPYYGKSNKMTIGKYRDTQKTDSARNCFRFATIDIVEAEQRFTLLALPVTALDKSEEILRQLLDYARKRIRIRNLIVDRGFFNSNCISLLNSLGQKYLMPAVRNIRIKRHIECLTPPFVIKDYALGSTTFNLVIIEEKNIKLIYATNEQFDKDEPGLSKKLKELYDKRWGIETGYRVKNDMRPRTTSPNFKIRLFYFLFSCLLYNLWIIADILICLFIFGRKRKEHVIIAYNFISFLLDSNFG